MTTKLNERLSTWLEGMRPWYWWLARGNPVTLSILVALLVFVLFLHASWIFGPTSRELPLKSGLSIAIAISVIPGGILWLAGTGLMKGFPAGVFATGQGKRRHDLYDKLRWIAVIGFPLSIIASVIAAAIYGQ